MVYDIRAVCGYHQPQLAVFIVLVERFINKIAYEGPLRLWIETQFGFFYMDMHILLQIALVDLGSEFFKSVLFVQIVQHRALESILE